MIWHLSLFVGGVSASCLTCLPGGCVPSWHPPARRCPHRMAWASRGVSVLAPAYFAAWHGRGGRGRHHLNWLILPLFRADRLHAWQQAPASASYLQQAAAIGGDRARAERGMDVDGWRTGSVTVSDNADAVHRRLPIYLSPASSLRSINARIFCCAAAARASFGWRRFCGASWNGTDALGATRGISLCRYYSPGAAGYSGLSLETIAAHCATARTRSVQWRGAGGVEWWLRGGSRRRAALTARCASSASGTWPLRSRQNAQAWRRYRRRACAACMPAALAYFRWFSGAPRAARGRCGAAR